MPAADLKRLAELSRQRLHEIKPGRVKSILGQDVLDEAWMRFREALQNPTTATVGAWRS